MSIPLKAANKYLAHYTQTGLGAESGIRRARLGAGNAPNILVEVPRLDRPEAAGLERLHHVAARGEAEEAPVKCATRRSNGRVPSSDK